MITIIYNIVMICMYIYIYIYIIYTLICVYIYIYIYVCYLYYINVLNTARKDSGQQKHTAPLQKEALEEKGRSLWAARPGSTGEHFRDSISQQGYIVIVISTIE